MIIAGAKGHAREVIQVLELAFDENELQKVCFFDDISEDLETALFNKYLIIKTLGEVKEHFITDNRFIIATGSPASRYLISVKLLANGGKLNSIVAPTAFIGNHNVVLGQGLNIMHHVMITNEVIIGEGTLLNASSSVHHNVKVGRYNEIAPGVRLLGNVETGDFCQIGASATVLPKVKIGSNVIVGAGAVVNRDIEENSVAVGVPARIVRKLPEPLWI